MKQQWQTLSETQIRHFTSYRECSSLISECGVGVGVGVGGWSVASMAE